MNAAMLVLTQIVNALTQANAAAPVVIATVDTVVNFWRQHAAASGEPDPFEGLLPAQIIDQLETSLRANVNFGDEEIARLTAKLAAAAPTDPPAQG